MTPRRPKRTTTAARCAPKLPDLAGRRFAPGAPNRAWVSDITDVSTGEGWLYLAAVLDLGSRWLLGYQMSDRIDTRLVADALDMAGAARQDRTAGIVFHSDRGSQHRTKSLRSRVAGWGLAQSVVCVRSSADGAVAEAFFSSLKRELVHRRNYPDRATARRSIFEWLTRYNTHRRHTSRDCRTPDEHEAHYRHTAGNQPALST